MLIEKRLTNIISEKYIAKLHKYVVELGIDGESKQTIWLTEEQMINLHRCFYETPKGFSNKDVSVMGIWNECGYYVYSRVWHHEQPKLFREPRQLDLADLKEVD